MPVMRCSLRLPPRRLNRGEKLYDSGRLVMATYLSSPTATPHLILSVYLPTGTDGKEARRDFQHALLD